MPLPIRQPSISTRIAEAGQRLETCLAYSSHATPVLREAMMSDAAVFQARRRKRADLAEQWLAEIPVTTQHAWIRSRAEAAILEAKGDVAGAMNKLAETETAPSRSPRTHSAKHSSACCRGGRPTCAVVEP